MRDMRAFFRRHAALAMLIVMLAIGLRALMPAGYMTSASGNGMTIELCSGVAGQTIAVALPGSHDSGGSDHGRSHVDSPCAFAGLGGGALAAVDPFVLTILVAFIMKAGLLPIAIRLPARRGHVRPPLRGPPAVA